MFERTEVGLMANGKFTLEDMKEKIIALFGSRHKMFLLGAGCSKCAGLPLMAELTEEVLNSFEENNDDFGQLITDLKSDFEAKEASQKDGMTSKSGNQSSPNIEDYLSQLSHYLATLQRRPAGAKVTIGQEEYSKETLEDAIKEIKAKVSKLISERQVRSEIHEKFVAAVHRKTRPGRPENICKTHYFVLNYDTLLENALALEQIRYVDGMVGGSVGYWTPDSFKDKEAEVLKLHGSLDWYNLPDNKAIYRLPEKLANEVADRQFVIAPAESKYAETQEEPYRTLLERFSSALTAQRDSVLFIMGYSFGDRHINTRITDALSSNSHLTVVVLIDVLPKNFPDNDQHLENILFITKKTFKARGREYDLDEDDHWKFENFLALVGENG